MLISIADVLSADEVKFFRSRLDHASWGDGDVTAGFQSRTVKRNAQLPEGSPESRELGSLVLDALDKNLLFLSAALPASVYPPLFNRYDVGHGFGNHVDNALRQVRGSTKRIRRWRTGDRRHLWSPCCEAACRTHDSLSRNQRAPGAARNTWRTRRIVFLDPVACSRRRAAAHTV